MCHLIGNFTIARWYMCTALALFVIVRANIGTDAVYNVTRNNRGKGSMWWGLAKAGEPNNLSPMMPGALYIDSSVHRTLRRKQRRLVRDNIGILEAIARGANMAINECQYQFRNMRWNCSTRNILKGRNLFGRIVEKGTPETALLYAIMSAGVTHSIARACAESSIETCYCKKHKDKEVKNFAWGGCSDNIDFGLYAGREFVDAGERGKTLREKMNLHNNDAGRNYIKDEMHRECKCHGMSGSCAMRTCWIRVSSFRHIGDILRRKYDSAVRIIASNSETSKSNKAHNNNRLPKNALAIATNSIHTTHPKIHQRRHKYDFQLKPYIHDHKPPDFKDLVYFEILPGFCEKNSKYGIQGTQGRQCNETSTEQDNCDLMCCGRGYRSEEIVVVERCKCVFHWCCEVKCEVCRTKKKVQYCF